MEGMCLYNAIWSLNQIMSTVYMRIIFDGRDITRDIMRIYNCPSGMISIDLVVDKVEKGKDGITTIYVNVDEVV